MLPDMNSIQKRKRGFNFEVLVLDLKSFMLKRYSDCKNERLCEKLFVLTRNTYSPSSSVLNAVADTTLLAVPCEALHSAPALAAALPGQDALSLRLSRQQSLSRTGQQYPTDASAEVRYA